MGSPWPGAPTSLAIGAGRKARQGSLPVSCASLTGWKMKMERCGPERARTHRSMLGKIERRSSADFVIHHFLTHELIAFSCAVPGSERVAAVGGVGQARPCGKAGGGRPRGRSDQVAGQQPPGQAPPQRSPVPRNRGRRFPQSARGSRSGGAERRAGSGHGGARRPKLGEPGNRQQQPLGQSNDVGKRRRRVQRSGGRASRAR